MGKTALAASRQNMFMMDPRDLTIIGLDTADGPEHPLWDKRIGLGVDDGLVDSIDDLGVLENVLVSKDGDLVLVNAGRQRVRAARAVNDRRRVEGRDLIKVPVVVKRYTGADQGAKAMEVKLAENAHRRNDPPLTVAENIQRYLDQGRTEHQAARLLGMTVPQVRKTLKLLDLDPKVQKYVETGKLSATAAAKLSDLRRSEQVTKAAELISEAGGKRVTTEAATAAVGKASNGRQTSKRPGVKDIRKRLETEKSAEAQKVLRWVLGEA